MIPVVAFVGHHDSGKTGLVVEIIKRLVERGYRVGTVKHAPNLEQVDVAGSDSARHQEAGACRTLLRARTTSLLIYEHRQVGDLAREICALFAECDVVIVEGDKSGPWPKVEVFRRGRDASRAPLAGEIDVLAVITDDRIALPDGVERFGTRDIERIADFVEGLLRDDTVDCFRNTLPLR